MSAFLRRQNYRSRRYRILSGITDMRILITDRDCDQDEIVICAKNETNMEECLQLNTVKRVQRLHGRGNGPTHWSASSKEHACRTPYLTHANVGMYVIFLKDLRNAITSDTAAAHYDFQENTGIHRSRSRQCFGSKADGSTFTGSGWVCFSTRPVARHPRPPYKRLYVLFYAVNALHALSAQQETDGDRSPAKNRRRDQRATDRHSDLIIASAIELLLNYCDRFTTDSSSPEKKVNKDTLGAFEQLLNDYFVSDKPARLGTPTAAWCAEQLHPPRITSAT